MTSLAFGRAAGAAEGVLGVLRDGRKCVAVGKNYLKHISEMQHTHGNRSAEVMRSLNMSLFFSSLSPFSLGVDRRTAHVLPPTVPHMGFLN